MTQGVIGSYHIVSFFEVLKFCEFHGCDRFVKFKSSKNYIN